VVANINLALATVMLGSLSAVSGGMPLTLNWLEIAGIPLAASAICALAGAYVSTASALGLIARHGDQQTLRRAEEIRIRLSRPSSGTSAAS